MSKTINLTAVKLRPSLSAPEVEQNLAKEIGNAIYGQSKNYDEWNLGQKLYYAEGPIELSDADIKIIKSYLTAGFFFWVQEAVNKILDE